MPLKGHVVAPLLAISVISCHDPGRYSLTTDDVREILSLTPDPAALLADGISRTVITAQIPADTRTESRDISFTTSLGTLIGQSTNNGATIVRADATGRAVVELRSELLSESRIAHVTAVVAGVTQTLNVPFNRPAVSDVLSLGTNVNALPADGFSRALVTGTLALSGGTTQQRTIVFKTTLGTLFAPGQSGNSVSVPVDLAGRATVELRASRDVGTALVSGEALNVVASTIVSFTAIDPSYLIQLTTSRNSTDADNVSPITVSATINPGLPPDQRTVTFSSTLGNITPSSVALTSGNIARADLTSNIAGVARITAAVAGTSIDTTVSFRRSYPDRLVVILQQPSVSASSSNGVVVRTSLVRDVGTISAGTIILYRALDSGGHQVGSFGGTNTNGTSSETTFFAAGVTPGTVTIVAEVEGASIQGSATVSVVP